MDKVRVGVIGVGLMGSLFANLASQLPDSELAGVADIDERRAVGLGKALGVPAFADYGDLLAISELDAVVVTTPDALHLEPALAASALGKHLLIEKPLATTPEDGLRIVESCRDAGVTLMVAHVLRFDRSYGEAFRAVRGGQLGEVIHLAARRCEEPGHRTPLPLWQKLPIIVGVILGLVLAKQVLRGFMPTFPMVTIITVYEARRILWAICRAAPSAVLGIAPMQIVAHMAQPSLGLGGALALGWAAFLAVMIPLSWRMWFAPPPSEGDRPEPAA